RSRDSADVDLRYQSRHRAISRTGRARSVATRGRVDDYSHCRDWEAAPKAAAMVSPRFRAGCDAVRVLGFLSRDLRRTERRCGDNRVLEACLCGLASARGRCREFSAVVTRQKAGIPRLQELRYLEVAASAVR